MKQRRYRGFTLLEVLLVVLLMGLAASAVTLTLGQSTKQQELDRLASRFRVATELVLDETVLSGQFLGVVVDDDRYRFVYYDDDRWHELPPDRLTAEQQLPVGVQLQLVLDGMPLEQDDDEEESSWFDDPFIESAEAKQQVIPQIMLFPSGEVTAFELTFFTKDESNQPIESLIVADSLGRLTMGRPDAF